MWYILRNVKLHDTLYPQLKKGTDLDELHVTDISCGYTTPRLGVFPRLMISAWCRLGVPRVSDYPKRRGYTPNKLPKANKLKHFHLAGNG